MFSVINVGMNNNWRFGCVVYVLEDSGFGSPQGQQTASPPKGSKAGLTLRQLMFYIYIYIYGALILDVFRSHTTTQHSQ